MMTQRARFAQLAANDEPTMAESMRSTVAAPDECRTSWVEEYPLEERINSSRDASDVGDEGPTLMGNRGSWASLSKDDDRDSAEVVDPDDGDVYVIDRASMPVIIDVPPSLIANRSTIRPRSIDAVTRPVAAIDAVTRPVAAVVPPPPRTPHAQTPPQGQPQAHTLRAQTPPPPPPPPPRGQTPPPPSQTPRSQAPLTVNGARLSQAKPAKATPDESGTRVVASSRPPPTVLDAVEERYAKDGHWGDLVELYLQRLDDARGVSARAAILRRIGEVMRDKLDDGGQALDAFVEALILEPTDEKTAIAVETLTRAQNRWASVVQTLVSQLDDVRADENGRVRDLRLCEHLVRWTKTHLGRRDQADVLLERIRSIDSTHPAVHRRMASVYREHGEWDAQRDALDMALLGARQVGEQRTLHVQLGELNEQRLHDLAAAATHYERALAIDPNGMDALRGLERICRTENRFVDLAQVLERQVEAANSDEARVTALLRLAEVEERNFVRPQQAAPKLEEALAIAPGHEEVLLALERCYRAMRSWGDLVRTLEARAAIVRKKNEKIELLVHAAEILETTIGEPERATLVYRRIYELDDRNVIAITELARLCERGRDWSGAAAYRARLADLAPTPEMKARLHVAIGEMLVPTDRDPGLARVHFERATHIHPACTAAWEALEREAHKVDAIDRVAEYLEKRVEHTDSARLRSQLLAKLGGLRIALGEESLATDAFARAIEADPSNEKAAEAMLERHTKAGRWAEAQPLCDLLVNAATRDGDGDRAFALLRTATSIALALGNEDRAMTAALAAFASRADSPEAWDDVLSVCKRAGENLAVVDRANHALDAIQDRINDLSPSTVGRLGEVRRAQGEDELAIQLYARALSVDPESRNALAGLADLYVDRGDWERACAYKLKLAHAVNDPDEQFVLLVDTGELWSHKANNLAMAALAYEEAQALRPRDHWLLHTLMWLYGELECWEKLVEILRAVADVEKDKSRRSKSIYAMAQVLRDKLGDSPRAATVFEEALDLDPKRLEAFERIVRIHTELRDWNELKSAYGRMLRRLKSDGDVELKYALFFQLGLIFRDRLVDAARALDSFRAAARLKPDDDDVRKVLCELFVVTDQIDAAISMVRAAIAKRPQEPSLYDELYSLFLRKGEFDKAWCALDAMTTVGGTFNADQARYYADYPPPHLSSVPGTLTSGAWRSHVLHADLEPALTALFSTVMPAVQRARLAVVPPTWLAKSLGAPIAPETASALRVLTILHDGSEILGLTVPPLHACKGPVPLAPTLARPAMFASLEACDGLTDQALAFTAGKRLAELRPELAARSVFPTVTELKALVHTAVQLAEGQPAPATSRGAQAAFDAALRATITADERRALKDVIKAAQAQGMSLDVAHWSQLADVSAARVGLLLAGRLEPARKATMNETQSPGDLTPREKLNELLVFSVSDAYADLRAAIGIAVGGDEA